MITISCPPTSLCTENSATRLRSGGTTCTLDNINFVDLTIHAVDPNRYTVDLTIHAVDPNRYTVDLTIHAVDPNRYTVDLTKHAVGAP